MADENKELNLSDNAKKVMDMVEKMTVLELNDLVKALEEKFGVSAAAPMMMGAMPMGGANGAEAVVEEEKTEFDVIIAEAGANSMLDISDGLSTDLNHICRLSKKAAIIDAAKIPISKDAKQLQNALNDGEDFELLFTISPKNFERLKKNWKFKTKLTAIGKITKGDSAKIKMPLGKICDLLPGGYDHLK